MNFEDLFYILALQKIEGVGDIVAKKLINHCGSAKEIFSAKSQHLRNIDGIGEVLLKNLKEKSVFQKAESELKFIQSYFKLLQTRHGEAVKLHLQIDKRYEPYLLPSLSLQLLVEQRKPSSLKPHRLLLLQEQEQKVLDRSLEHDLPY